MILPFRTGPTHAKAPRELAGKVDRYADRLTRGDVLVGEDRIAEVDGRAQRAAGREGGDEGGGRLGLGHGVRSSRKSRRKGEEGEAEAAASLRGARPDFLLEKGKRAHRRRAAIA